MRKVLGASVSSITLLLSKDFARLVIVALVLATPIVFIALSGWLDGFAYRTSVNLGKIVFAGFLTLVVSIATVSYQSIRAALLDPVDCVRDE